MPAWLIPAITAAASLAGNLFNTSSTRKTNQQQTDVNAQLYDKQRADALQDWNRQNAYNSPSQQMQRFKEAGLNPNLVYGQMTNAPVIRSTEAKAPDYVAPRIDTSQVGNILGSYYDIKSKELMLKNQELANQIAEQELQGKTRLNTIGQQTMPEQADAYRLRNDKLRADIDSTIADWSNKRLASSLYGPQYEKLIEETKNIVTNREYQQNQIAISKIMQQSGLLELNLKGEQIKGAQLDNKVKELELRLRNLNLSPSLISDLLKIAVSSLFK